MSKQTEAERLAEIMSQMAKGQKTELGDYWSPVWCKKAAAELLRLVSLNNDLMDEVTRLQKREFVGLTAAGRKEIERQSVYVEGAIRMTEAKLKEKNT